MKAQDPSSQKGGRFAELRSYAVAHRAFAEVDPQFRSALACFRAGGSFLLTSGCKEHKEVKIANDYAAFRSWEFLCERVSLPCDIIATALKLFLRCGVLNCDGGCLGTSTITVFLVEDSRPYRSFIASVLREHSGWSLVGTASDGLEAVAKARELLPDLILMDIGLPTLNGLEAARRIRKITPATKIVFLTQETDSDVAEEALNLGACGYVLKQQAGTELLPALAAVLRGERFLSRGIFNGLNSGQVDEPT